jgi:hypothetical protein
MSIMEKFFGDARIWSDAKKAPHFAHKIFLRLITTDTADVLKTLGMDEEVSAPTTQVLKKYVYASDGAKFSNSVPGRANLARYEEKLRRVK